MQSEYMSGSILKRRTYPLGGVLYLHLLHELMNTDQADPNKQLRLSIVL